MQPNHTWIRIRNRFNRLDLDQHIINAVTKHCFFERIFKNYERTRNSLILAWPPIFSKHGNSIFSFIFLEHPRVLQQHNIRLTWRKFTRCRRCKVSGKNSYPVRYRYSSFYRIQECKQCFLPSDFEWIRILMMIRSWKLHIRLRLMIPSGIFISYN
jgi:hypothetical protein